ncbi:MAG: hypothetical protein M1814_001024 [Vezdaea aestivalis]|nr:MAG: hypothetical protein M1814_001024 [Vezdaea aestivalis]
MGGNISKPSRNDDDATSVMSNPAESVYVEGADGPLDVHNKDLAQLWTHPEFQYESEQRAATRGWSFHELFYSGTIGETKRGQTGLTNQVHPLFHRRAFSTITDKMYAAIVPALQLASRFLTLKDTGDFWYSLTHQQFNVVRHHGEKHRNEFQKLLQHDDSSTFDRYIRALKELDRIGQNVNFLRDQYIEYDTYHHGQSPMNTGQCYVKAFYRSRDVFKIRNKCKKCTVYMRAEVFEVIEGLVALENANQLDDLDRGRLTRQYVEFAATICHEVAHSIYWLCTPDWNYDTRLEAYFPGKPFAENGFLWEISVFGGRFSQVYENVAGATGFQMYSLFSAHEEFDKRTLRRIRYNGPLNWNQRSLIPHSWSVKLMTDSFWMDEVTKHGVAAIKPQIVYGLITDWGTDEGGDRDIDYDIWPIPTKKGRSIPPNGEPCNAQHPPTRVLKQAHHQVVDSNNVAIAHPLDDTLDLTDEFPFDIPVDVDIYCPPADACDSLKRAWISVAPARPVPATPRSDKSTPVMDDWPPRSPVDTSRGGDSPEKQPSPEIGQPSSNQWDQPSSSESATQIAGSPVDSDTHTTVTFTPLVKQVSEAESSHITSPAGPTPGPVNADSPATDAPPTSPVKSPATALFNPYVDLPGPPPFHISRPVCLPVQSPSTRSLLADSPLTESPFCESFRLESPVPESPPADSAIVDSPRDESLLDDSLLDDTLLTEFSLADPPPTKSQPAKSPSDIPQPGWPLPPSPSHIPLPDSPSPLSPSSIPLPDSPLSPSLSDFPLSPSPLSSNLPLPPLPPSSPGVGSPRPDSPTYTLPVGTLKKSEASAEEKKRARDLLWTTLDDYVRSQTGSIGNLRPHPEPSRNVESRANFYEDEDPMEPQGLETITEESERSQSIDGAPPLVQETPPLFNRDSSSDSEAM